MPEFNADDLAQLFEEAKTEEIQDVEIEAKQSTETKSESTETDLQIFERLFHRFNADREIMDKIRAGVRAKKIKSRPDVDELARKFLEELSGAQPFQMEISPTPLFTFKFQFCDSKAIEETYQQWHRDSSMSRSLTDRSDSLISNYRAARSLVLFQAKNPGDGSIIREVGSIEKLDGYATFTSPDVTDLDLPCRKLYIYIRDKVFSSGSLYQQFLYAAAEFEEVVSNLSFLLVHEPSFFSRESVQGS